MAEAVVSIALETLRDLLEEGRFLSGVSAEVKALEALLKEVKCLLEDADRRRRESKTVLNWIAEIRDLAHRAEDAIETYAFHVSSNKRRRFTLKRLLSCSAHAFFLHRIASEISEIRSEISRVTKSMQEYGIQSIIHGETPAPNQKWKRQTFPFETEECFVGKKDKLKQILYLIVEDNHNRVISIWGMGGIGKTTIARKVCNHIDAKRSFDCFAWVCITQQCHIRSVLEDVLKQLMPQKRDDVPSLSDTELVGQLWEIQHGRKISGKLITGMD